MKHQIDARKKEFAIYTIEQRVALHINFRKWEMLEKNIRWK